jgi:hypothetical protein
MPSNTIRVCSVAATAAADALSLRAMESVVAGDAGSRLLRLRGGLPRSRRGEQLAELLLAESRGARDEIDSRYLARLGSLA